MFHLLVRTFALTMLATTLGLTVARAAFAQSQLPRYERTTCAFEGAQAIPSVQCGTLLVPEVPSRPGSPTLRLSVAILKALAAHPKPDPVVFLSGGPGGRAIQDAAAWRDRPFARDRDIVLIDQRGTGRSEPLCPGAAMEVFQVMARDLSPEQDVEENVAVARRCLHDLQKRGLDPSAFASAATAVDLESLRVQLGYPPWNLLGVSYGSRLALTALRDAPGNIRSVVLDSVFPPEADFYHNLAHSFEPAVRLLDSDCSTSSSCSGLGTRFDADLRALDAKVQQHPLTIPLDDPALAGGMFVVNAQDLRFLVGEQMVFGASRAVLPAMVHAWLRGNTASLAALLRVTATGLGGHDLGKYYAVQCHEEMPFSDRRAAPPMRHSATAFHDAVAQVCAQWDLPLADPRENQPVHSAIPALVLSGQLDPRSPPAFANDAARHLDRAVLVPVPGEGHNTLANGCVGGVVAAFLDHPTIPPDRSCFTAQSTIPPLGALRETSGPILVLRMVQRGSPMLLWPGATLLITMSSILIWPIRSVVRRLRTSRPSANHPGKALSHVLLGVAALVQWGFMITLVVGMVRLLRGPYALAILAGLPTSLSTLFLLPKLAVALCMGGVYVAAAGWAKGRWPPIDRAHFAATIAALTGWVAFLIRVDLF